MTEANALISAALQQLGPKPADTASSREKGRYSEQMSQFLALALSAGFSERGLIGTNNVSTTGYSWRIRRGTKALRGAWSKEGRRQLVDGGIWALLGVSIKTINFRDRKSNNFQKNLTNRRGDMLFEAVTLHQRFPYSVLIGLLCLDAEANNDSTRKRRSTFANVHPRLRLFTGRNDPAGRNEQFERFYVALVNGDMNPPVLRLFRIGEPDVEISFETFFAECLAILAERNPDFYQFADGHLSVAD